MPSLFLLIAKCWGRALLSVFAYACNYESVTHSSDACGAEFEKVYAVLFSVLVLEYFYFVAVGVGDKSHLFAIDEFLAPVAGPEVNCEVEAFEHFTVVDDVVDANAGMDEVFWDVDLVVGGVGELQIVCTAWYLQVCELVAGGRFVGAA